MSAAPDPALPDVYYIEDLAQAIALLKPARVELLQHLDRPRTCPELADIFGDSAQRIYYHVKALQTAGLVQKVDERRVRGINEGYYQAVARSFWLSPELVGRIGSEEAANSRSSLAYLLSLAEEMHTDLGRLGQRGEAVPALGLSAHIHLPDAARRQEFLAEVQALFEGLARKYGLPAADFSLEDGAGFRLILAAYPKNVEENNTNASDAD
jgi:DNA-binding transcriptional ArsR family regulator